MHLDVVSMEIAIDSDGPPGNQIREILPVRRKVYSRLGTRRTEYGKASSCRRFAIDFAKTFRHLKFSHLPVYPNQFLVSVLYWRSDICWEKCNMRENIPELLLGKHCRSFFLASERSSGQKFAFHHVNSIVIQHIQHKSSFRSVKSRREQSVKE